MTLEVARFDLPRKQLDVKTVQSAGSPYLNQLQLVQGLHSPA